MAKQHKGVSVEEKLKEKLICIEEGMNAERNRSKREGKKQLHSIKASYVMSHNLSASQTSFFSGSYFFLFFFKSPIPDHHLYFLRTLLQSFLLFHAWISLHYSHQPLNVLPGRG